MELQILAAASRLFEYPGTDYLEVVRRLEAESESVSSAARQKFSLLSSDLEQLGLEEQRELYTRTFDLTPVCAPYLSVHLFGESSFQRAKLMTGLAELYASKGMTPKSELPDHIAVVLDALSSLEPEEQRDLLTLCLKPSLEKMREALERQNNVYASAIAALEGLTATSNVDLEVAS